METHGRSGGCRIDCKGFHEAGGVYARRVDRLVHHVASTSEDVDDHFVRRQLKVGVLGVRLGCQIIVLPRLIEE